jgi:NAD(P)-dependent dehydrogenase (short-subunit alcohol dehydrogenase family)
MQVSYRFTAEERMELGLNGRTALVTGGTRGIGYGIAEVLAVEGCDLHITGRTPESVEKARSSLAARYGVEVTGHALDLAAAGSAETLARSCGTPDILVNNAGAVPEGTIESIDEATWRSAWDLKVFGYINLTRALYGPMCRRGSGVIVNVVGRAGERPSPTHLAGSMGNAALMAMSKAMGAASINHGVRVLAVNPGAIETDRQIERWRERASKKFGDETRWRELTVGYPGGRLGTVREVAALVAFLCSDLSSYTTGTVITVDGGASSK